MGIVSQEAVNQFKALMDQVEEALKKTYQNIHQGYQTETLVRFLKAREWNVVKAHKMLVDCLIWRVQNEIDRILEDWGPMRHLKVCIHPGAASAGSFGCAYVHCGVLLSSLTEVHRYILNDRPIIPSELYRDVRDSQLIGMSGYSREGHPVFAIGVGLSTFDKASVHYYVQSHIQINEYRDRVILPTASKRYERPITTCVKVLDMTGLKFSALSQIKLLTIISSIDDLNYPEKTNTYYIVNAPYIFSACWKVVKPLLQERTRKKVQVLSGNGRDELLKIMDFASLPHFCKQEGSGSSRHSGNGTENCFSLDHPFHQQLYNYIKHQAMVNESAAPIKQGSFHVDLPEPPAGGTEIAKSIESELHKFGNDNRNGLSSIP